MLWYILWKSKGQQKTVVKEHTAQDDNIVDARKHKKHFAYRKLEIKSVYKYEICTEYDEKPSQVAHDSQYFLRNLLV